MPKLKGVIILASSRSQGDTFKICARLKAYTGFEIIDLKPMDISIYDYEHKNKDDDFLPLMNRIVNEYDLIVFATPVYWYSMSATLKIFFDRISDCLTIQKETGRKLRGKQMAMLSCSSGDDLVKGFNMPFVQTADYLGMEYVGDVHLWLKDDQIPDEVDRRLQSFVQKLS